MRGQEFTGISQGLDLGLLFFGEIDKQALHGGNRIDQEVPPGEGMRLVPKNREFSAAIVG
jgi:hypothetical protein